MLYCLLDSDQTNIIASLVGRSLGFGQVVRRIADRQFQRICNELGLENTVLPNRAVASHLVDMLRGEKSLEMSSLITGDGEIFNFVVDGQDAVALEELELPQDTRIIYLYRDDAFRLPESISALEAGRGNPVITPRECLDELKERWAPQNEHSR